MIQIYSFGCPYTDIQISTSKSLFTKLILSRKHINKTVEGTGHGSRDKRKPRVLTECEEGELASRNKKIVSSGFPLTSQKIRDTATCMQSKEVLEDLAPSIKLQARSRSRVFLKDTLL